MINTNTSKNKNWQIGAIVNVGFLKGLRVVEIHRVKDFLPDIYVLERDGKYYEFIPHNGLRKLEF